MNFDDALKHHLPQLWYRVQFFKYKYLGRGERELALIPHLIAPGSTALDVGCSIGMYEAEMARYAGKVIAFEANPAVAAFTQSVVPRNVEVINVALSSASGRATLRVPLNAKGREVSELATLHAQAGLQADTIQGVEVETKRLDDCAISSCSFIKVDVEGHEEAVLDGASNLIATQRPVLMVELDEGLNPGTVKRFAGRLMESQYRGFFLSRGKLHPIEAFEPATHQDQALLAYSRKTLPASREYINNFVFIPDEKCAQILRGPHRATIRVSP
jgi:FkbM family methyltransferase